MSATNRGTVRNTLDFYATPGWCTEGLVRLINWDKVNSFYEPCRGNGDIIKLIPLPQAKKKWSEISEGKDYLTEKHKQVDLIVTNPPYKFAEEFVRQALSHSTCTIMLLRLGFLESIKRHPFWLENPPSHLITLSNRPSFTGKGTDSAAYAWVVWNGKGFLLNDAPFQWIAKHHWDHSPMLIWDVKTDVVTIYPDLTVAAKMNEISLPQASKRLYSYPKRYKNQVYLPLMSREQFPKLSEIS